MASSLDAQYKSNADAKLESPNNDVEVIYGNFRPISWGKMENTEKGPIDAGPFQRVLQHLATILRQTRFADDLSFEMYDLYLAYLNAASSYP